jgi:carboxypeptidase C (cathepsin A)
MLIWRAAQPTVTLAQKPGDKSAEKTDTDKSDKGGDKKDDKKEEKKDEKRPEEKMVQSKHTIKIGGQEIKYTATAGTILLKLEDGTPKASVFYIAYTKDDVSDTAKRPVTFTFNGGPGSASIWLHLGAFGPRRVEMGDAGALLPPPYKLVDNESSLLDLTDLVFIDPVSTGYSRAVPGEALKQFHGIQQDIESVGDFIRLYATRNKRWSSPKFLAGESYGTTRAAGTFRIFAAAVWPVSERHHPDFFDSEFSDGGIRYGQRPTVRFIFADVHGNCVVSQEIAGGFAERRAAKGGGRVAELCRARVY